MLRRRWRVRLVESRAVDWGLELWKERLCALLIRLPRFRHEGGTDLGWAKNFWRVYVRILNDSGTVLLWGPHVSHTGLFFFGPVRSSSFPGSL